MSHEISDGKADICPKHDVHENCRLLNHFHLDGYCYRTFKMECGEVFTIENLEKHCRALIPMIKQAVYYYFHPIAHMRSAFQDYKKKNPSGTRGQ